MLDRLWDSSLQSKLDRFPVVGLIGSRQCGKTTLARSLLAGLGDRGVYLDLELPSDLAKLNDPETYLERHSDKLVVLDEVQHRPELFPLLRALVDRDRRSGRFLVLGSASPDLLRQSSESLAGRIAYLELPPFVLPEVANAASGHDALEQLWLRGGYPDSFLAPTDPASFEWRESFVRTYLERDLPQLGVRVPATRLRRFWQMLAHWHGQTWNASAFARNFDVSAPTVRSYLDLLTDTFVVRQLQPLHANVKKRLVKAPKVYLRDTGILHALLGLGDVEMLRGHPALGASFEGFCIEQILSLLPSTAQANYFGTHAGPEIDLVLSLDARTRIAVEIKFTSAPKLGRGMREAMADSGCAHGYVVTAGRDAFPLGDNVEAMPLARFLDEVALPGFGP